MLLSTVSSHANAPHCQLCDVLLLYCHLSSFITHSLSRTCPSLACSLHLLPYVLVFSDKITSFHFSSALVCRCQLHIYSQRLQYQRRRSCCAPRVQEAMQSPNLIALSSLTSKEHTSAHQRRDHSSSRSPTGTSRPRDGCCVGQLLFQGSRASPCNFAHHDRRVVCGDDFTVVASKKKYRMDRDQ